MTFLCLRYRVAGARHGLFLAHPPRMPAGIEPEQDAEARLDEIAEILALGLQRLRARKSSGKVRGEADFSLGTLALQSGAVAEFEGEST